MRQIKFRAWDGKKMRTSFVVHNESGLVMLEQPCGTEGSWLETQHSWNVMQFTGLKDKDGREIYEGDILDLMQDGKHLVTVGWDEKSCGFASYQNNERTSASLYGAELSRVIGNIYENPELLK